MLRPLRITCEIVASLVGLLVIIGLFLFWRLSAGPIRSSLLTPYIEASIENIVPGTEVQIAHSVLAWDDATHSVTLHADSLRINEKNGVAIAEIPLVDIRLNAIGALLGQFLPTELTIDHPQIKLDRHADGSFTFGDMSTASPETDDKNDDFKASIARAARHLTHAYFTRSLNIRRAVFDVHDSATNSDWSVNIPEITLEHSHGILSGKALVDVTQKDQAATVEVHYEYDRKDKLHRLLTRFSDITPSFFAGGHPATLGLAKAAMIDLPLTGEIALSLDDDIDLVSGDAQLHGDTGFLKNPDLWDKPRAVKSLDVKADYNRDEGVLNLSSAVMDFGGPRLTVSGSGEALSLSPRKMDFTLAVQTDEWPMDEFGNLWPKPIITNARDWIAANLSKGKFSHGEVTLKGKLDWDKPDDIDFTEGSGKVSATGARVRYVDNLPPVEGVNADATFDLNQLTAQIASGGIGDIRILPFAVTITGFENNVQKIDIPLKVTGPVPAIMRLIDNPPLNYAKAVGLTPDGIGGQAEAEVIFRFPLLKDLSVKDIDVNARASLTNISSSKLVKGIDITQGTLALDLTPGGFSIKGPANLNKVPFQIAWQQNFNQDDGKPLQQATLTGSIINEQWQALGIDAFNGSHGPMAISLQMTKPDKTRTLLSGTLDMTAADVRVDQLGWKKPAKSTAAITLAAEIPENKNIQITAIDAHGAGLNIKGKATLTPDGGLLALNLRPVVVGRTNANLNFSKFDDEKGTLHLDAEGESLDITPLKNRKPSEPSEAPDPRTQEYRINLGKLYTSENGFISHAEGYAIRDPQGWSEISLHGLADSGHQLDFDLALKQDGSRTLDVTCDDFGKALKGMGFTDTVRSGALEIHGSSDPDNPRAIAGNIKIGAFQVGHLPVLAVLMNAASPFGFGGLFTGGMDFDGLKSDFTWEGDIIRIMKLHASGAAVGINADGFVNVDSNEANLRGTMVPFSMISRIIGSIPLIGDLIAGSDKQGFLAVSYSIKGPLADPNINVNPVSLLTPGLLRNIFFGSSDDINEKSPESGNSP